MKVLILLSLTLLSVASPANALEHSIDVLNVDTRPTDLSARGSTVASTHIETSTLTTETIENETEHEVKLSTTPTRPNANINSTATTVMLKLKQQIDEQCVVADPFRPLYHFTPPAMWMNDPNGLIYYNGFYHLFYQYNPYDIKWGHMHWGHARSKDFIRWEHLPIALNEVNDRMIFSGSAVADYYNTSGFQHSRDIIPLIAVYTSHRERSDQRNIKRHEEQSIAISYDDGMKFIQYAHNPVLDIGSTDFRDPKVFWYKTSDRSGYWVMNVVSANDHQIVFYRSSNLINWTELSRFGPAGSVEGVWECPDLFQLHVNTHRPSHPQSTTLDRNAWVLLVSINPSTVKNLTHVHKICVMQYFIGSFDGVKFTAFDTKERCLDRGRDLYAAVTYNDEPRHIIHGWLNNWLYAKDTPTGKYGWRGQMTIPRQLHLHELHLYGPNHTPILQLYQTPVQELNTLRNNHYTLATLKPFLQYPLGFQGGKAFEFHTLFRVTKLRPTHVKFRIRSTADKSEGFVLGVKIQSTSRDDEICEESSGNIVYSDRRHAGIADFNPHFPFVQEACLPLLNGDLIKLHVFVDHSSVEVFIADGLLTMTESFFPTPNIDNHHFFMDVVEGEVEIVQMDLWEYDKSKRMH